MVLIIDNGDLKQGTMQLKKKVVLYYEQNIFNPPHISLWKVFNNKCKIVILMPLMILIIVGPFDV